MDSEMIKDVHQKGETLVSSWNLLLISIISKLEITSTVEIIAVKYLFLKLSFV